MFNEDVPKQVMTDHVVGMDIAMLSVDELALRIGLLHEEIKRLETVRQQKLASRASADLVFKR